MYSQQEWFLSEKFILMDTLQTWVEQPTKNIDTILRRKLLELIGMQKRKWVIC